MCEILKLQFSIGADVGVLKNMLHIFTTTPNGRILEKNYDSQNFFQNSQKFQFQVKIMVLRVKMMVWTFFSARKEALASV